MPVFEGLGKALRWLREKQGKKQYELAEEAQVTKAMLSAYETEKQRPSLGTLERILDALDADLATFGDALDWVNERVGERGESHPAAGRSRVRPAAGFGGIDVAWLLGLPSLAPEEERALGQMLDGFHRFLRYLHAAREEQDPRDGRPGGPGEGTG